MKALIKKIIWRLRGSPRCRRCGKPLYENGIADYGPACLKKRLAEMEAMFDEEIEKINQDKGGTNESEDKTAETGK